MQVHAEPAHAGEWKSGIGDVARSKLLLRLERQTWEHYAHHVIAVEDGSVQALQVAANANEWRFACDEQKVASGCIDEQSEPRLNTSNGCSIVAPLTVGIQFAAIVSSSLSGWSSISIRHYVRRMSLLK